MLNARSPISSLLVISSMGIFGPFGNLGFNSAAAFPTANKVFYIPVQVPFPFVVDLMSTINGTVSGNIALGVYSNNRGLPDARLIDTGSVAQAGANFEQRIEVTNFLLSPDLYWLALTMSNTTGQLQRSNAAALLLRMTGCMIETTGAFGLPAVATPTSPTDAYMPIISIRRLAN